MTGPDFMDPPARGRLRPLSPFLGIYKKQITSGVSIFHRITGIATFVGALVFVWWLVAIASGPEAYATVHWVMSSWVGYVCMVGWTATFYYHLCNGIRHLVWDTGRGFEAETTIRSGQAVLVCTTLFTAISWLIVSWKIGLICAALFAIVSLIIVFKR